jgi:hypothetical protein
VPVEVHLGREREVPAKLHKERAKVGVEAIEVEVVDHRGLFHQPRVPLARHRVAAAAGAPREGPLLRPTHEQDCVAAVVAGEVALGDVILAVVLTEVNQVPVVGGDVVVDVRREHPGHGQHQRRGHEPVAAMVAEEPVDAPPVLQPGLVEVDQHPIDRPDLEQHMVRQHLGRGTR